MEANCTDSVDIEGIPDEPTPTTSQSEDDSHVRPSEPLVPSEVENEEVVDDEDIDLNPPVLDREEPLHQDESIRSPHPTDNPENIISISPEDLAEAGLDMDSINNLTNEQISNLMEIAERRGQREVLATHRSNLTKQSALGNLNYAADGHSPPEPNDSITIVITDDGSLKVKDAMNQMFFFPAEQLNAMNIDVNNLTDDSISQIVNEAMPAIKVNRKQDDQQEIDSNNPPVYDQEIPIATTSSQKPDPEMIRLIGEQIEIRRSNGKSVLVRIRYVKSGGALKVQFEDGHFEWITEEQIIDRRAPNDHDGYHNGSTIASRVIHQSSAVSALKRGATVTGARDAKRINLEPNFCCPICENKVYQKEPAYIVIRIPACDSCTKEKIIVLDDERDGDVM